MNRETKLTRKRYNRIARVYNMMELMESSVETSWRRRLFNEIVGEDVLEVGVGTGRNLSFYDETKNIVGIDLSENMLSQARQRARKLGLDVNLMQADAQQLPFADNSFDSVVTACVFCSVPDPVKGLVELRRVLRPSGKMVMLEHVLSCRPFLRQTMQLLNPVVKRMVGANIDRDTLTNLTKAGFIVEAEDNLWLDVMKFIVARPNKK